MAVIDASEVAPAPAPAPASAEGGRSRPGPRLSPLELFAAAVALLLPVAYASGLEAETWSARSAILVVVSAVGLPILLAQTRGPKPLAARAAVAFIGTGCLSAVLSANHTAAVFGLYNQGTGLLFMVSLAASWAIGRTLRPPACSVVATALILGVGVNVAIALLGSVFGLPPSLAVNLLGDGGRSAALAGNPVHLAALAVLGLALIIPRFASTPARWALPVAAMAAAAQLSGTRSAIVVMAAIVVWAGRGQGVRVGAMLAVLLVLGLAVGSALGPSGVSATARASGPAVSGDWRPRLDTWLSARHAVAQRPLVGIGPGQFRSATSSYRSVTVARIGGPDRLFTDGHNLVVEYAVTTGLLGVAALLVWLVGAARQGRGWLLVGALGVLALHLFEPQTVVTTPLAFLALGAAGSPAAVAGVGKRPAIGRMVRLAAIVVAVSVAAVFVVGELDLKQAQLDLRLAPAQQAERLLPAWPRTASLLAQVWLYQGIVAHHSPSDYQASRSWRLAALQRDDTDPELWSVLAELDEANGRADQAGAELRTALRFNPTSVRAMNGLARLAQRNCDFAAERHWQQQAARVSAPGPVSSGLPAGVGQPVTPVCAGPGGG